MSKTIDEILDYYVTQVIASSMGMAVDMDKVNTKVKIQFKELTEARDKAKDIESRIDELNRVPFDGDTDYILDHFDNRRKQLRDNSSNEDKL